MRLDYLFPASGESGRRALDDVKRSLVVHRQVVRHPSLLLPSQHFLEVVLQSQWAVRIVGTRRLAAEAPVVVGDELRSESVGRVGTRHLSQSQLLHESILERLVCTLHAPLRLWAIRAENVD